GRHSDTHRCSPNRVPPMPVTVSCPACGAMLRVPTHLAGSGKTFSCPKCKAPIRQPGSASLPPAHVPLPSTVDNDEDEDAPNPRVKTGLIAGGIVLVAVMMALVAFLLAQARLGLAQKTARQESAPRPVVDVRKGDTDEMAIHKVARSYIGAD